MDRKGREYINITTEAKRAGEACRLELQAARRKIISQREFYSEIILAHCRKK